MTCWRRWFLSLTSSDYDESDFHFHPRVEVDGQMVDENIATLIKTVWDFGIRTVNCCQGGPESPFVWAWIQFYDVADGLKFLEGTGYLAGWTFGDNTHMYLTPPILPQAGPSPVVVMNPEKLSEITKLWVDGTAKNPQSGN